jgi:hypothetical protein
MPTKPVIMDPRFRGGDINQDDYQTGMHKETWQSRPAADRGGFDPRVKPGDRPLRESAGSPDGQKQWSAVGAL